MADLTPRRLSPARRPVWLPEARDFVETPIYDRDALRPGNRFAGPAIVEQMDATTPGCLRAMTAARRPLAQPDSRGFRVNF